MIGEFSLAMDCCHEIQESLVAVTDFQIDHGFNFQRT